MTPKKTGSEHASQISVGFETRNIRYESELLPVQTIGCVVAVSREYWFDTDGNADPARDGVGMQSKIWIMITPCDN